MDNLHERPIAGGSLAPQEEREGLSCGGVVSEMLSFVDFKRSLGLEATNYSDEQIDALRVAFDKIADITFDRWLLQKNTGTMH